MDFLRLVIIEKCEVKDIEIGQIMTMATSVDILENYFVNGQHNINFLFSTCLLQILNTRRQYQWP